MTTSREVCDLHELHPTSWFPVYIGYTWSRWVTGLRCNKKQCTVAAAVAGSDVGLSEHRQLRWSVFVGLQLVISQLHVAALVHSNHDVLKSSYTGVLTISPNCVLVKSPRHFDRLTLDEFMGGRSLVTFVSIIYRQCTASAFIEALECCMLVNFR